MAVLNVPAAKSVRSLPDPAISRTLPVCMSAAWMARTGDGLDALVHVPSHAAAASSRHATASGFMNRRIRNPPICPAPADVDTTADLPFYRPHWGGFARPRKSQGYVGDTHGGDRHDGLAVARVRDRDRHRARGRGRRRPSRL